MSVIKPSFAILAAGFRSGSLVHLSSYAEPISTRSLHIWGTGDEIIAPDLSETLAGDFTEPRIVQHTGGHYFAATAEQKPAYVETLQDWLQEHLEQQELRRHDGAEIGNGDEEEDDDAERRALSSSDDSS